MRSRQVVGNVVSEWNRGRYDGCEELDAWEVRRLWRARFVYVVVRV